MWEGRLQASFERRATVSDLFICPPGRPGDRCERKCACQPGMRSRESERIIYFSVIAEGTRRECMPCAPPTHRSRAAEDWAHSTTRRLPRHRVLMVAKRGQAGMPALRAMGVRRPTPADQECSEEKKAGGGHGRCRRNGRDGDCAVRQKWVPLRPSTRLPRGIALRAPAPGSPLHSWTT